MPETFTAEAQPASTTTPDADAEPAFNAVGIELEYPLGSTSYHEGPDLRARRSGDLIGKDWQLGIEGLDDTMQAGSDHVGAEIRSPVFDLHSDQPEKWYIQSIEHAEGMGFPFAANGYGSTVFGLHMHLSQLQENQRDFIHRLCTEEDWMRVFVCSSISNNSADPWRHAGVTSTEMDTSNDEVSATRGRMIRQNGGRAQRHQTGKYEWRLPEPMMPSQFSMVMHFLRLVSLDELDEAEEYAREAVLSRDDRLTPIMQYKMAREEGDGFPHTGALLEDSSTDPQAAAYMADLMGDL